MNQNPLPADAHAPASLGAPSAPQNQTPNPSGGGPAAEPWQFGAPPAPRQPVPATALDGGLTLLCFAAAWCYLRLAWTGFLGLGMLLFTAAFAGMVLLYRRCAGLPVPRGSYLWLFVMLLSAASFPLLDNGPVAWLNLLFLTTITPYWVAALGGNRVEDRLGEYLAADLWDQLFIVPFQNFGCFGSVLTKSLGKTRLGKSLATGLLTLLCAFPLLWFVCRELSSVATGFGDALERLGRVLSIQNLLSPTTIFAIPTAFYLYGLIYGNQHKRYTGSLTLEKLESAARRRRVLPPAAAYALLSVLCLIYALFFVIGAAEMITFTRSGGLTPYDYSQFARKGFFELCRVSAVNLLVLWGVRLLLNTSSRRSSAPVRIFNSLLCCQTLLLIALALCKMGLYIRFCGVTRLRVSTTWFMVVLGVCFGLLLLSQFREIPLVRWSAAACCALFLLLCWTDIDGMVVKNAVWRYESLGDTEAVSRDALADYTGGGGAAQLYRLWLRESEKESSPVLGELTGLLETAARRSWSNRGSLDSLAHWNLQRANSWSLCRGFLPQPEWEQGWTQP